MNGSVRKATIEDADAIGRVHYLAHVETYTGKFPPEVIEGNPPERRAQMWRRIIGEQLGDARVAELDGETVGFTHTGPARDRVLPSKRIQTGRCGKD
ncbi:MAG: hypothetical protein KF801_06950 [Cryobacterium sp.]|nr:hypothetical protein [Cryobacterium sp.]